MNSFGLAWGVAIAGLSVLVSASCNNKRMDEDAGGGGYPAQSGNTGGASGGGGKAGKSASRVDASSDRSGILGGESGKASSVGESGASSSGGRSGEFGDTNAGTGGVHDGTGPEIPSGRGGSKADALTGAGALTGGNATREAGNGGTTSRSDTSSTVSTPERPWQCKDAAAPSGAARATVPWPGTDTPVNIGTGQPPTSTGTFPPVFAFPGVAIVSHTPLFPACPDYVLRLDSPGDLTFVDLNSDHKLDFALRRRPQSLAVTNSLSFYTQAALGSATKVGAITLARGDWLDQFAVADLNRDGLGDVVIAHHRGTDFREAELAIYHQQRDGFLQNSDFAIVPAAQGTAVCNATQAIALDDMNGDGLTDIVLLTRATPVYPSDDCPRPGARILVLIQEQTSGFAVQQELTPPNADPDCELCTTSVATGDVDGDGRKDLVVLLMGLTDGLKAGTGFDTLVYRQGAAGFPDQPTQTLRLDQYLSQARLADVNGDGHLDILVRPSRFDNVGTLFRFGKPSLSGVFLGNSTGVFEEEARTVRVSLSALPYETRSLDPFGIDVREVNGDGALDLAVNRFGNSDSVYLKYHGLYGTTPNAEAGTVLRDLIARSNQQLDVKLDSSPESSVIGITGKLNRLGYYLSDIDTDGQEDFVAGFSPFAPATSQDPQTGSYGPSAYFEPNTYTDVYLHLKRTPERLLVVEIPEIVVDSADKTLHVQIKLTNLAATAADNVRLRILTQVSPVSYHNPISMLADEYGSVATEARSTIYDQENTIRGEPLGNDLLVPHLEPSATVAVAVQVPVAFVKDLVGNALFAVVDPDVNVNVIYKDSYTFIK